MKHLFKLSLRRALNTGFFILFYSGVYCQCNSFTVANVPAPIQQANAMGCWAVTFTLLYEWKNNQTSSVDNVMSQIGDPYNTYYQTVAGLGAADKTAFIQKTGLEFEYPASFSVSGWCNLLQTYGLLWVTTDVLPNLKQTAIHARILYGISTDASGNTTMLFLDPATGSTLVADFNNFIVEYESELRKVYKQLAGQDLPAGYQPRIQIIHW